MVVAAFGSLTSPKSVSRVSPAYGNSGGHRWRGQLRGDQCGSEPLHRGHSRRIEFSRDEEFATGEGGCVVTGDRQVAVRLTRALNFGFHGSRDSVAASTNGKMSEYHAAVGLAELDGWAQKCRALARVANRYRQSLDRVGLSGHFVGTPAVAGCYALFGAKDVRESTRVQERLARSDIEFRLWYGTGLLQQQYFRDVSHDPLPVSESIAPVLIGLPIATDLTDEVIERVVAALAE